VNRWAWVRDNALPLLLRWFLGGVFLVAAVPKILHPDQFAIDISHYRLMPYAWINLLAITLPWVELAAGALLVARVWARASAWAITGMMVMFVAVIASALARGLNIECGCFGTIAGRRIGLTSLAFDLALLGAAIWLSWRERD
jgi:putative oxidoreductase